METGRWVVLRKLNPNLPQGDTQDPTIIIYFGCPRFKKRDCTHIIVDYRAAIKLDLMHTSARLYLHRVSLHRAFGTFDDCYIQRDIYGTMAFRRNAVTLDCDGAADLIPPIGSMFQVTLSSHFWGAGRMSAFGY
jgi:hypothetical protein